MTQQFFSFVNSHNAMASSSSFNSKRKARNDESDDEQEATPMRVRSPPLKRRVTTEFQQVHYSNNNVPDLMTDHSNSASDEDTMMDQDTDGDQAMDGMDMEARELEGQGGGYASQYAHVFGNDGSGGMGFGPGAEEDMMSESSESSKTNYPTVYPSLTPHTNPNHFSNIPPYLSNTVVRSTSPLSAQAFSTSLQAPRGGVFQPTVSAPLAATATEVEKARSTHGPHCRSIPRLVISPYADPDTGKQSMYSMCPDCGACEKAA